jgi:tryptophanyl-tRNA synthetase
MSKSYGNCIYITEPEDVIRDKVARMMTDPHRVRRNDPGDPELSPVFAYHKIYSSPSEIEEVARGCRTASIGCVDCKKILTRNILRVLAPIREKRLDLEGRMDWVREQMRLGTDAARRQARETMADVREAIGLGKPL